MRCYHGIVPEPFRDRSHDASRRLSDSHGVSGTSFTTGFNSLFDHFYTPDKEMRGTIVQYIDVQGLGGSGEVTAASASTFWAEKEQPQP